VNVLAIGDTHVPDFARALPDWIVPHLGWAEQILHTGDATSPDVLTELGVYAPIRAVMGNIDGWEVAAWGAPEQLELELGGVRIGMVHDSGLAKGREARMHRRFPNADLVVFGHSHQPLFERGEEVALLNPGSPTWKRCAPAPTVARLVVQDGRFDAALVSP
jgi:putative phosphoesterase